MASSVITCEYDILRRPDKFPSERVTTTSTTPGVRSSPLDHARRALVPPRPRPACVREHPNHARRAFVHTPTTPGVRSRPNYDPCSRPPYARPATTTPVPDRRFAHDDSLSRPVCAVRARRDIIDARPACRHHARRDIPDTLGQLQLGSSAQDPSPASHTTRVTLPGPISLAPLPGPSVSRGFAPGAIA